MNLKTAAAILLIFSLLAGCSNKYQQYVANYTFTAENGVPDFSRLDYWAAHPDKKDPSDSVPEPLRQNYHQDTSVDVFFIYPTTYTDRKKMLGPNGPVDDALLDARTDYTTILLQASIFNEAGRIFSPRYRQANLAAYFPKTAADSSAAIAAFELAYQDVKTAFLYYLQHNNNGHPIIIASHSQGTTHAKRLLKELFDGKPLEKQLVAAYIIGIAVEPDAFTSLKPCTSADQTGCIISWRTYRKDYKPGFVLNEKFTAIVTNPLTWDSNVPDAGRELNKGGILLNFNKIAKNTADASVNGGVLWINKPRFPGSSFYRSKNYHVGDLNLFYLNIRENVALRVAAYRKKRSCRATGPTKYTPRYRT